MLLVDDGESIAVRPVPDDPIAAVRRKYAWIDVTSDELRAESRIDATERDDPR